MLDDSAQAPGRLRFPCRRIDPFTPPEQYVGEHGRPSLVDLEYGGQAWLVTEYKHARRVLGDTGFSSDSTRPAYPRFPVAPPKRMPGHFLSMDAPEHTRLRRTIANGFTVHALHPMRTVMVAYATELVDRVIRPDQPFDLVEEFAAPLHGRVMARLFGVPAEDHDLFRHCAEGLFAVETSPLSRAAATARLKRYLHRLLRDRARHENGSVIARLASNVESGDLTEDDAVGIAHLIVMAGQESTIGLLGLVIASLMRDRSEWRRVCDEPNRWARPAVREALRYWTVVHHGVARVAIEAADLSGAKVAAGDPVVVHLPSANRDPVMFLNPGQFRLARDPRTHLAFGHGMHRCLGGALTELEASIAVEALARRVPNLQLAMDEEKIEFLHDRLVYGVRKLLLVDTTGVIL
jgi:cytochrome P450